MSKDNGLFYVVSDGAEELCSPNPKETGLFPSLEKVPERIRRRSLRGQRHRRTIHPSHIYCHLYRSVEP